MGKLRILNKIRDLTDVDKRHVFDDPFRYKVISPFRVISPVEVMNNANGMRQVNGEGVAGDNFAQPANDNQFPPGNGDGGDWDNQGYPPPSPPPGDGGDQWFDGPNQPEPGNGPDNQGYPLGQPGLPDYPSSPSLQPGLLNFIQMLYDFPDDDEPYPELNSAELEEDANEVVEFTEAEQRGMAHEDAGVQLRKEFVQEQHRKHMEQMKEICQTVKQTAPEIVAATLPKIYNPVVEIVEEAKTSS